MSWYVQFLVSNVDGIRESIMSQNVETSEYGEVTPIIQSSIEITKDRFVKVTEQRVDLPIEVSLSINFDDDIYNDLLILEKKIKEMKELGLLESKDIKILLGISMGFSFDEVGQKVEMDRKSIRLRFRRICDTVAFYIGGIYTDDGFVEYAREKYNLKQEQVEKLSKIIEENRRI